MVKKTTFFAAGGVALAVAGVAALLLGALKRGLPSARC